MWSDKNETQWIVINKLLYVGIPESDKYYFRKFNISKDLIGQPIIVRGKPTYKAKRWRIEPKHPAQLIIYP